jgi:hypothetical protein
MKGWNLDRFMAIEKLPPLQSALSEKEDKSWEIGSLV